MRTLGRTDSDEEELSKNRIEAERESLRQLISDFFDLPLAILSLIWVGLLIIELVYPLSPEAWYLVGQRVERIGRRDEIAAIERLTRELERLNTMLDRLQSKSQPTDRSNGEGM